MKRSGQLQRRPFPVPVGKGGQIVWSSLTRHQELGRGTRLAVVRADAAPVMPIRRTRNSGPTPEDRKRVLERDGHACVCCGRSVIGQRYSLGHRLRASQGGKATPENLLTFLGWGGEQCHGRIDNRSNEEDEDRGLTVRSHLDPALVPVRLFTGEEVWLTPDGRYSYEPPDGAAA